VCVVNALIKGETESLCGLRTGGCCFLMRWVIDNVVWTNSWLSIACAGCGLIGVGAGEERARKVHSSGPLGVE
jgi:hypothetical protein